MDLKISDLPPQFENIAIELGIDKIKALFKELIPILKLSSFPSIRTSKYIVTIAGKPKLATNCIKSSSNDIFLQIIF